MLKLIVASGLCAVAAFAQTPLPPPNVFVQKPVVIADENFSGPIGITAALAGPTATVPGAPYSAQAVTQHVQVLSDGNRITRTTTNSVARDSKGRVYREESLPGLDSNAEPPHLILIEDPVAGQHITLDSNSKTAIRTPAAQMKKADEAAARQDGPPMGQGITLMFDTVGSGQPPLASRHENQGGRREGCHNGSRQADHRRRSRARHQNHAHYSGRRNGQRLADRDHD